MTITVVDPQQLDLKEKPIIYTRAFVKIYKWHNCILVHETYGMAELKKYSISRTKKALNLSLYQFYKILLILRNADIV